MLCTRIATLAFLPSLAGTALLARADTPAGVDYMAAVEQFAESDGAVGPTPDWSLETLQHLEPRLGFLLATSSEPLRRSAVILHLAAATRAGLQGHDDLWKEHLQLARALLPLAAPQDDEFRSATERLALRRAVPLVEACILMRRHRLLDAIGVLQSRPATDDPHWQLALGMSQELLATSPQLLAAETKDDPAAAAILASRNRSVGGQHALELERRQRLEAAERSLAAVAASSPALQEARLRLGRTRLLLGKRQEGEADLERLLNDGASAPTACLARLFLGTSAAARGAWREAVAQHRAGVAACPQAQSLRFALSHSLQGADDATGSRQESRTASELEPHDVDPWLRYNAEPQHGIAEIIGELRGR